MSYETEIDDLTVEDYFRRFGEFEIDDKERKWVFYSDGKEKMGGKFRKGQNML